MSTHKFTFDTTVIINRGLRGEYEADITVTYSTSANGEDVEIAQVLKWAGKPITTTQSVDDDIYDIITKRVDADLQEWHSEQEEYRAETIREERMIRDFQS